MAWWADRSLGTKALAAVGIPAAALLVASVAFFYVGAEAQAARRSAARAHDVGDLIHATRTALVDAETSVRGYLLTGDDAFLEPYRASVAELPSILERLRARVDNAAQAERAAALGPLVERREALFRQILVSGPVTPDGLPPEEHAMLDRGKAVMDELRTVIDAMERAEEAEAAERSARAEAATAAGQVLVGGVLLLGQAGSILAALLLTAGVVRRVRRLNRTAEQLATGEPVEPLPPTRDEIGRLAADLERASALLGRREQALRDALDEANDLYERAPVGYHSLDRDGVFVRVNDTELGWLGYTREELVGRRRATDLMTARSAEVFARRFPEFKERGWIAGQELELIRRDGSILPVEVSATLIRDEGGNYLASRSTITDITARRAVERDLARSRAELERFFSLSRDLFMISDLEGRIRSANASWERALGAAPGQLVGRRYLDFVHPDDRAATEAEAERQRRDGAPTIRFENRYRFADGRDHWLEWAAQPILEAGVVIAVARDQTERKQIEADLQSARREAEGANRAKTEFLGRMSHELRTPLNAILGFAQLLGLDDLEGDQRESQQQILKAGRHLLDLINEVLDISRIEAGELSISPEPVALAEVVREAAGLISPLAAAAGSRVSVPEPPGAPHVLADRQRLCQVLLNLLSNAVKYNRPDGLVRVAWAPTGGVVRIVVSDEGSGIPPELQARLFRPFERLGAEAGPVEGTGLGLALSKALVEHMGGRIGVDSEPGRTAFWVELPAAGSPALGDHRPEAASPSTARLAPAAVAGGEAAGTVLCIEDNLSNIRLVERALALRPGVRLLPAMLGRLGLDLARRHRPDLVLVDLHLPDVAGEEVIGRLRTDPATRDIPIVVLSADATPGQVERLLASGARAYLTKPFDLGEFLALVDDLLAAHPVS